MKKLIMIIAVLFATSSYGQTIHGRKIENIDAEYIQISGSNKRPNPTIVIDWGQFSGSKTGSIINKDGRVIKFASPMAAVNYMVKYGYEVVNLSNTSVGMGIGYFYLLKKTKDENE